MAEDDDDFSPEDAFNMFTPIYRPSHRDRPDFNVALPPDLFDDDDGVGVTVDSSVTLTGGGPVGGGPQSIGIGLRNASTFGVGGGPFQTAGRGSIFGGQSQDAVGVPLIVSLIGICSLLGNLLVLLALVGLRRMRSGPSLMLSNIAVADVMFVAVAVPTTIATHVWPDSVGPMACRFVHYVIFVAVYVTVYTLVVVCVFGFFGELMRGGRDATGTGSRSSPSSGTGLHHPVPLSMCSAGVSCAVIWGAFAASHLTFVLQTDVNGLAAFEEPFICAYGASTAVPASAPSSSPDSSSSASTDPARARTLWVTFLACAFVLPLTIVCALSAAVMRMQRRRRSTPAGCRLAAVVDSAGVDETIQNVDNDGRSSKRETTVIVMATTVARSVCWLPLQVFVLVDVFGPASDVMASVVDDSSYRKWEMLCVCCALLGACASPPIYGLVSIECRDAFRVVLRRLCCRSRRRRCQPDVADGSFLGARRVVGLEPPAPSSPSPSVTTAALYRQHGYVDDITHLHHHSPYAPHQTLYQQQQQQQMAQRPQQLSLKPCRLSGSDMNETIMSIISDSSNHINYT